MEEEASNIEVVIRSMEGPVDVVDMFDSAIRSLGFQYPSMVL